MKIRVERHDNPVIGPSVVENLAIGGSAEPDVRRVDGVDTVSGQMSGGGSWAFPDPAANASGGTEPDLFVVQIARGEFQGLAHVVVVQLGILLFELPAVRVKGDGLHHALNGQAHSPDAGLAVHDGRVNGDAVETVVHRDVPSKANRLSEAVTNSSVILLCIEHSSQTLNGVPEAALAAEKAHNST